MYHMAAALISPTDVVSATKVVRELVTKGRRRTHFCDEGDHEREKIIACFLELPVKVLVCSSPRQAGDDQEARNACISGLLVAFARLRVSYAVFDSRGVDRDKIDRAAIVRAMKIGIAQPEAFTYTHRGSRDEALLGIPDAFAWCYGARKIWRQKIEGFITEVTCP